MTFNKIFQKLCICFSMILFSNFIAFAENFDADNTSSFEAALSKANAQPEQQHTININGDISLDSSISEAISLELAGSNSENHYNFALNGHTFTYDGADKSSEISNLNILTDVKGSGITIKNQQFTVSNTNFTGSTSIKNDISAITNNGGDLYISNSAFTKNSSGLTSGAINNTGNGSLRISDSLISENYGFNGGAFYQNNGNTVITNTKISDNTASRFGGAIYVNDGSLNIKDSDVSDNSTDAYGGALYINGGTVTIDNTNFNENKVTGNSIGGAIYNSNNGNLIIQNGSSFTNNSVEKGAAGAINNLGTLTVDNTLFDGNIALNEGGGIDNSGTLTVTNSSFSNNSSTNSYGGAIGGGGDITISGSTFDNNSAKEYGGAISIMAGNGVISNCKFTNNSAESIWGGGAIINYMSTIDLNNSNIFENNTSSGRGGAITATTRSVTNITGSASFINNTAEDLGGAIFAQGTVNINANNPDAPVIFSGNKDSTGSNAFHLDIYYNDDPISIGTMNLNVSNGAKIILADNISGVEGTKLNIKGTSSYNDKVYLGSANENLKSDVTTDNISLEFYNEQSGLPNGKISAANTHFNLMNGFITDSRMNLDLSGGGNSLSIDVDPAALTCDYIDMTGDPANITQLVIRDITVLSDPIQSVTIFDIFDHDKYGTDLVLSPELENSIVYGALKTYKWALTPKLTLIELGGFNPNIQRYQAATAAAFMNQMLSYDYSLNRTDEIYTNLREQRLASRKLNSYAFAGPGGMYIDQYYEDGTAFWMRPYVNIESFHLSNAYASVNNQSYGAMLGFDFPMIETKKYDWKIFPTIYASYIGSCQQYIDSEMYQNGGYGGFLLSAYKDDFYAGWTINGGGLGVESKYGYGKDDYAIITAGTALKLAYNWKIRNRLILQPNFTTAYTFLNPTNLVNFQSVDISQSQVNGLTIAPSLRLTYRNEEGYEPYIFGGCVIPLMSDVKLTADGNHLDKLTLNAWAQFGAGVRKRISERITCFAETVIRTGGRTGWGFMFNIQIAL